MRPHPRIWKTIKWGGAAVTVLLVVVWVGSGWGYVSWRSNSGWRIGVSGGGVFVERLDSMTFLAPDGKGIGTYQYPSGWLNGLTSWRLDLSVRLRARIVPNYVTTWVLPFWPVGCTAGLIAVKAWRLDILARRRERIGKCPKCGYDRTGLLQDAKCPECGAVPEAARS